MRFSPVKMALYMKIANELDVVVGGAFNPLSGQQREVGGSLSPTQPRPILGIETSPATVEIDMEAPQIYFRT